MSLSKRMGIFTSYRAALARAEVLQAQLTDDNLLVCVIYESHWNRWIGHCVDPNTWSKESFPGGHRAYCAEVWRENDSGNNLYLLPEDNSSRSASSW